MDGSRHSLAYVQEVTYGVTPATPVFKALRHTGTTLGMSRDTLISNELRSDRMIPGVRGGSQQVAGDIDFEFSFGSFDDILAAVLCGNWVVDGGGTGIDRLKAGSVRRSFTLERDFADATDKRYHRFTGVEFDTMSLAVAANSLVTGSFGTIGQAQALAAAIVTGATYPAASTTEVFDSFNGEIRDDGVVIAVVTEVNLELNNGLATRYVVGSRNSLRPSIGRSNLSGTIGAYFETVALLEKFINEENSSIAFDLPDIDGNSYTVVAPKLKYMGGQPDVSGEGPVLLSMPFQAMLDEATDTNFYIDRVAA